MFKRVSSSYCSSMCDELKRPGCTSYSLFRIWYSAQRQARSAIAYAVQVPAAFTVFVVALAIAKFLTALLTSVT